MDDDSKCNPGKRCSYFTVCTISNWPSVESIITNCYNVSFQVMCKSECYMGR